MKTTNSKGISFGFSAVNAGQRNVSAQPELIATSTEGGFRITAPVSKVLGLRPGDFVQFFNNINNIDEAIRTGHEVVLAFCNEQGLDINTPEAVVAIHREFDCWGICKSVAVLDTKGNPVYCTERLTKNDKAKFVEAHFNDMLEQAANAPEEVKDALFRDGITVEEQAVILQQFVQARELPKFNGSKTANPSGLTGVGVTLSFTDSNVWNQLKADLKEEAASKNRTYAIDLDNIQDVEIDNGYQKILVKGLILGDFADTNPIDRSKKEEGAE